MSVNDPSKEQVKTGEEYKKERPRVRLIPIWLRIVILVVLIFGCALSGAVVGYGMLGNGRVADVFKASTWTHIRDLVKKE
ncbi:DNA-directed RNA polymerase subunit beta [Neobacillus ginsengisoli]|uniref:DNA-directed RNA polymerase subunit beta n=1 Tax=Neobacillus ginsengisoli TaxID=904295 RepID=A0ABT9XZ24_9BACI|nr:DNA-directed RNA polymerase subunit beta [Neobacillus ginsengisoli]MDQ0200826.1 hypothetical protein [Neobacillus ginsengisoli]